MNSRVRVFFRVDGNQEIGLGHFYRCLALAEALKDRGAEPFVCTKDKEEARLVFGKEAEIIPVEEEQEFFRVLERFPGSIAVADHYGLGEDFFDEAREHAGLLVIIDDLNRLGFYNADVIVNQNVYAKELDYNAAEGCLCLKGLEYVMLRKGFRQRFREKRKWDGRLRLMVSFGGTDPKKLALVAARALRRVKLDFSPVFALGASPGLGEDIEKALAGWENGFDIRQPEKDMPGIMSECHLALAAAGTTLYELAFSGVPAITVCWASNQRGIAEGMAKEGFSIDLGDAEHVSEESVIYEVETLLEDKELLKKRAVLGRKLVDGMGAGRVAESVLKRFEKKKHVR